MKNGENIMHINKNGQKFWYAGYFTIYTMVAIGSGAKDGRAFKACCRSGIDYLNIYERSEDRWGLRVSG